MPIAVQSALMVVFGVNIEMNDMEWYHALFWFVVAVFAVMGVLTTILALTGGVCK